MKLAGIILIVLGIIALAYQTFSYTVNKQDAKLGPVVISHDETHSVWVPPVVGAVLIIGGVGALVASGRSKL
jgi:uncharacterized membrane protein